MLYADYVRGKDSTGAAVVSADTCEDGADHTISTYKRALASYDFIHTPGFNKVLSSTLPVLMMGHNRARTKGAVSDANAHPFTQGKITLTHNGTLTNMHSLPDSNFFSTDSENIANLINDRGIEETAQLMLGAWALVWWNSEEKSLNFYRNKERPLHYTILKDGCTILYASSENILRWVCEHHGFTMEGEDSTHIGSVYEVPEDTLYTFPLGETVPTEQHIEPMKEPVKTYGQGYWSSPKGGNSPLKKDVKKGNLESVLDKLVGESIPFASTSAHTYINKKDKYKSVFITGRVPKDFLREIIPEIKDMQVTLRCRTILDIKFVNANLGMWVGSIKDYHVYSDMSTVTIVLDNISPCPNFKLKDAIEDAKDSLKEEEPPEKKNLYVTGPEGIMVPSTEFNLMVSCGCVGCLKPLTVDDADSTAWVQGEYPVCGKCFKEDKDIKDWVHNLNIATS